MNRRWAGGRVGPVEARGAGTLHEQGDLERVLRRALALRAGPLDARRDVDADHRGFARGGCDRRGRQATGEDDRELAGNGGDERRCGASPGAAGMRATGRVEEEARRARGEVFAAQGDDARRCRSGVRGLLRGEVDRLPRRPADPGDQLRRLVARELHGVGVQRGDDLGDSFLARVGGDGDDERRAAARRQGADDPPQLDRLVERELARCAGNEIQPDGIGAGPDRGEDAVGVGHAADLHERPVGGVCRIGRLATGLDERGDRGPRVARPDERLADERGVEAHGPPAGDRRGVANTGLRDDDPVVGHEVAQPDRPLRVDVERPQVAVVEADQPRVRRERPLQLALVVGLDERLEADLQGTIDEGRELALRVQDREQQDEVGAGRAEVRQLDRLDDELLGEDRDAHRRPDRPQVVDGSTEPVRLAENADRGRAAGLVRSGAGHDVVVGGGDLAGRRRAALDLGNDVESGRGEPVEDRPRRGRRSGDREVVIERERRHLLADVGAAAFGDLRDDVALSVAIPRRPRFVELRWLEPIDDRHAGAPSAWPATAAAATASASLRSARSRSSSSVPSPASIVSAARSTPSSSVSTADATRSAAPAFSSTTSRRTPGSPWRTASVIAAFSAADPPASRDVGALPRPSDAATTARRSIPSGVTS
jgi:hypothetical protein